MLPGSLLLNLFLLNATWLSGKPSANNFLHLIFKLPSWLYFSLNDCPYAVPDKTAIKSAHSFYRPLKYVISMTSDSDRRSTNRQSVLSIFNSLMLNSSINAVGDSLLAEPYLSWVCLIPRSADILKFLPTSPFSVNILMRRTCHNFILNNATESLTQWLTIFF